MLGANNNGFQLLFNNNKKAAPLNIHTYDEAQIHDLLNSVLLLQQWYADYYIVVRLNM